MRTVLTVLLCASMAYAEPPADAPVCPVEQGRSMLLQAGEIVPFTSTCIDEKEHIRRECINERNVGELESAKSNVWLSKGALVGIVLGSLALGAAVTVGVTLAVKK